MLKKSRAGGAALESRSTLQQQRPLIFTSLKKKRVAVDQYLSNKLLDEIPMRRPHKGEIIVSPGVLPALVKQTAGNRFYCEVCQAVSNSFTQLQNHRGGKLHRKNVIIGAIKLNRFSFVFCFIC